MKLQWILLALFLIAIVRNLAKAMRNPMLKNFLRLVSILVAFIITFILQICGVFQFIAGKIVGGLELASKVPDFEGAIANAIDLVLPFCTTLLSPLLFTLVFVIIFLILRIVHVNLVYKFIVKRQRKKEIREFRQALREEKKRMKQAIVDNEERFLSSMEHMILEHPELDPYEYESLTDDEIDKMVNERLKAEKKKKKKAGFFKESKERKAISLVCGVVSGFLLFGILWMGMFYTMDVLSDVTDGIKETNADDTKIYQMVEMVDKHVVTPYEESFVYKLYDSMAMVDLLNYTVRAGGKLEVNGETIYADDVMRDHMMRSVRLACEITSAKSEQSHIGEDISVITKDPITVSIMADFFVALMEKTEPQDLDPNNPASVIFSNILHNYQGENNRELFIQDLGAVSDVVVIAAENRLLAKIIEDSSDMGELFTDRDMVKKLIKTMSHLSFYGSTMEGAFMLGVETVGPMLMPYDNEAAYTMFVNQIASSASGITTLTDENLDNLKTFIKNATTYEKNALNDNEGLLAYIVDPLYKIQGLKDSANNFKTQADELEATATDLTNRATQLEADAAELDLMAKDIQKQIDEFDITGMTPEEVEAALLSLENQKSALVSGYDAAMAQAEQLRIEAEEFKQDVEEFRNDLQDLVDEAQTYVSEFEERIKGFTPFLTYFMNWNSVQKPFMLANEDTSKACLAIEIDGTVYVCNTDILSIESILDFVLNDDAFDSLTGGNTEGGETGGESNEEDDETNDIIDFDINTYIDKIPMHDLIEQLEITDSASAEAGKVSPLTDLVVYLMLTANKDKNESKEIDSEWVYETLEAYRSENTEEACVNLVNKIIDAKDAPETFEYLGVTVVNMENHMYFGDDEWSLEEKESDSETLVDIIYTLMGLMDTMNGTNVEQMEDVSGETEGDGASEGETSTSELEGLISILETLGTTMDEMATTSCLKDLPPMMLEGILKNEKLSMVLTPAMLIDEMDKINAVKANYELGENRDPELTYNNYMSDLLGTIQNVLDKINNKGGNEA